MHNSKITNQTLPVNEESYISEDHDEDISIQRCPHDDENPYAQVSRELIRDKSISPECRWLIIYILSMKDGWKLNPKQLVKHLKGITGRDRVYEILNEAIEAGYIKRELFKTGNLKQHIKYFVSERPKFKKCFRHPEIQDTEIRDTENQDIKKEYNKERTSKEEYTSLKVSDETETAKAVEVENTPSSEKPKRVKSEFSPRVREVANKLLQIVVDDSPSYIIPKKLTSLLQEVHYMLNDDKRDPEVLYAVLRSGLADPYNGPPLVNGNLGKKLREKFVTLEKKMNMSSKLPEVKRDRKFAPCSNDQKAIAIMEEMDKRAI